MTSAIPNVYTVIQEKENMIPSQVKLCNFSPFTDVPDLPVPDKKILYTM